jgi:hypothetical protein
MPQVEEGQSVVLEPKYCEGCGALGLRLRGQNLAICARCRRRQLELEAERRRLADAGRCA